MLAVVAGLGQCRFDLLRLGVGQRRRGPCSRTAGRSRGCRARADRSPGSRPCAAAPRSWSAAHACCGSSRGRPHGARGAAGQVDDLRTIGLGAAVAHRSGRPREGDRRRHRPRPRRHPVAAQTPDRLRDSARASRRRGPGQSDRRHPDPGGWPSGSWRSDRRRGRQPGWPWHPAWRRAASWSTGRSRCRPDRRSRTARRRHRYRGPGSRRARRRRQPWRRLARRLQPRDLAPADDALARRQGQPLRRTHPLAEAALHALVDQRDRPPAAASGSSGGLSDRR